MELLLKIGRKVIDSWFPNEKGTVTKSNETQVIVKFPTGKRSYYPREFRYLKEVKAPEEIKWKS